MVRAWTAAWLGRSIDPILIVIEGRWLNLDHATMLALLGHELGHYLAHVSSERYARMQARCRLARSSERLGDLARCFLRAGELTADRFGLLAAQDLEAALRLEMLGTSGLDEGALFGDTDFYLRQCQEVVLKILARGPESTYSWLSHPEHAIRAYCLWLFSESDLYRSLTGSGTGGRPIEEIDARIEELLPIPEAPFASEPEPSTEAAPPAPAPATEEAVSPAAKPAIYSGAGPAEGFEATLREAADEWQRTKRDWRRAMALAGPRVRQLYGALSGTSASPSEHDESLSTERSSDLADDDEAALLERFAELERRTKGDS